ncbi:MAG: CBS domain-containing protein [Candidatus Micrarchaeota archaeon]|nr:CBS domain-containing protein [Candidatus Micrarchaeota archaeon]
MKVKDVMKTDVKTVSPDIDIKKAAKLMSEHGIGSLVVVENERVVGILTERDILEKVVATGLNPENTRVSEIMTKNVITVSPDKSLEDAAEIMTKNKIKKLPVVWNNQLVGIVTASDLIAFEEKLVETLSSLFILKSPTLVGS